ncbi:MAG: hemerythrin family protein [Desulfamplus sp.]|nr:hemerythrin family protein [Desulfamplus sp.]
MPKITWSELLSVGNEEIDNQHKRWIEIFNTSYDKMMCDDYSLLSNIGIDALKQMMEYAQMHFEFEEKYMQQINYPALVEHKFQHDLFKVQLHKINQNFENGISKLNSEIMKMIENWLIGHIQTEDQKYKFFTTNLGNKDDSKSGL